MLAASPALDASGRAGYYGPPQSHHVDTLAVRGMGVQRRVYRARCATVRVLRALSAAAALLSVEPCSAVGVHTVLSFDFCPTAVPYSIGRERTESMGLSYEEGRTSLLTESSHCRPPGCSAALRAGASLRRREISSTASAGLNSRRVSP
jgi:hypothetical protein